jgi:uncharacterized protein YaiE (UPF0345 family)
MRRVIILLSILVLTISCEKFIDMEIPDHGRKIVVNCFFSDTDTIIVNLSKSVFILDNSEFYAVSGALVRIFDNNTLVATCSEFEQGKYKAIGFVPQKGKRYKIEVVKENDTLFSTSILPQSIPFVIADTSLIVRDYNTYFRVKINLNDPVGVKNYYMIQFSLDKTMDSLYYHDPFVYFSSDDKVIETYYENGGIFSDALFDGKTKSISFDLNTYDFWNDTNKLKINLYSLSEEMYLYIVSYVAQQNTSFSPFAEPVIVFNNIENGYGIFAGYSVFSDTLFVPKLNEWGYYKE